MYSPGSVFTNNGFKSKSLTTIMNKDKIAPYIDKYLGKFSKHNLNEVNMKRYKETFLEFENHIDNLISNSNQKKMYTRT